MGVVAVLSVFLSVDVLAVVVFAHLYRAEHQRYLLWWVGSFATLFVAQAAGGPALVGVQVVPLQAIGLPLIVVSTLLMVRGTSELLGVRWRAWWAVAGAAAFLFAVVALVNGASFAVSSSAPMLFLASAWAGMGVAVWVSPNRPAGLGAGLTLAASLLSAVHFADFPFLGDEPAFAPWGMALAAFNEVAVCLGFLMLHSERSRAARDLAETRSRELAETVGVALLELSPEGRLTAASPALVRLLGYEREAEVLALERARDLELEAPGVDLSSRIDAQGVLAGVELRWKRRDGKRVVLQLHARVVREQGRVTGFRGFVVDRTTAVELEERALHAQKLEAVGQLAGGVAHDFNNLLTVIHSAHDLLEPSLKTDDERELLRDAREAASQAAHLTRRLLAFGRKQPFHAQVFDVAAVVRRAASMLERTLAPRHRIDLTGVRGPCHVRMDPGHLEQVVVNLVLNARDAMTEGSIALSVGAAPRGELPGVELSVVDHGRGMDPDEQRRVFEPFFTTKSSGRGSGLGLPTVQGIVQQAGGAISVESEKGRGSRFTVWLPAVEAPVAQLSEPGPHQRLPPGLRVLVVDDEAAIRRTLTRVLQAAGCVTAEASSGAEVVQRFEAGERYGLLLSDVRMPGGDGPEAARAVRRLAPDTRVILMSGFTDRLDEAESPVADAFLGKPFANDELLAAIRAVLAP